MAIQFAILKPLLTVVPLVLAYSGVFDIENSLPPLTEDRQINFYSPKLWVIICQNLSVLVAFVGLLSFFHGTEHYLEW